MKGDGAAGHGRWREVEETVRLVALGRDDHGLGRQGAAIVEPDVARLEGQIRRLIRSCEELDAGRAEEVRDLVWYHLVRNFTGAAKAAHNDKALQMAELVLAATLSGDFVRAPALASALQQWIDENSGELRADHG